MLGAADTAVGSVGGALGSAGAAAGPAAGAHGSAGAGLGTGGAGLRSAATAASSHSFLGRDTSVPPAWAPKLGGATHTKDEAGPGAAGTGLGSAGYTTPNTMITLGVHRKIAMRQQVEGELTVTAAAAKGKRENIGRGSQCAA